MFNNAENDQCSHAAEALKSRSSVFLDRACKKSLPKAKCEEKQIKIKLNLKLKLVWKSLNFLMC